MPPFRPSNIAMICLSSFQELLKEDFSCDPLTGKATTSAQDRAILAMDPPIISVAEGDLILKKGTKVNQKILRNIPNFFRFPLKTVIFSRSESSSHLEPFCFPSYISVLFCRAFGEIPLAQELLPL